MLGLLSRYCFCDVEGVCGCATPSEGGANAVAYEAPIKNEVVILVEGNGSVL